MPFLYIETMLPVCYGGLYTGGTSRSHEGDARQTSHGASPAPFVGYLHAPRCAITGGPTGVPTRDPEFSGSDDPDAGGGAPADRDSHAPARGGHAAHPSLPDTTRLADR